MQTTLEKPAGAEPTKRRVGLLALAGVAIAIAIGVAAWLVVGDGDRTPTDVIQDVATAMRNDDTAMLREVTNGEDLWFLEWQIAMKAEPEFTDCVESETTVRCSITYGDEFFYAQVTGEEITSRIGGMIDTEGRFVGTSLPPWNTLREVENDFKTFIEETHPELSDSLTGQPSFLSFKMTRETGELRMQFLDEFMAWRG